MNTKLLAIIILIAPTVALGSSALISGSQALASSGSNDKCVTSWQRDDSGYGVGTGCGDDKDAVNQAKKDCREFGDSKCSSSQTGQGTFDNNPNKGDEGGGITEKFEH